MHTPHNALPEGIRVEPIRAFSDNYIWCLHDGTHAVVIDPGQAEPVQAFLHQNNLQLSGILITHHHYDHTGGITKLVSMRPDIPVSGPEGGHIRGITHAVREDDTVTLPQLNCTFSVLAVPGHTLDHIAFYGHGALFCGDTLFNGGCGRLFEGSAQQMLQSLSKFQHLAEDTVVYCAHEYTQANLAFARAVEPDNETLAEYQQEVAQLRKKDRPTVPTRLSLQYQINPFLRAHEPTVAAAARQKSDESLTDEVSVFAAIRQWKDNF